MIENRSLRSVMLIVVGWVSCRAILLNLPLPQPVVQNSTTIGQADTSAASTAQATFPTHASFARHDRIVDAQFRRHVVAIAKIQPVSIANSSVMRASSFVEAAALPKTREFDQAWTTFEPVLSVRPDLPQTLPAGVRAKRWSVSTWLLQRAGARGVALATNGQLGGSQVGFRAQRELFHPLHGIEARLNVRVSSAIATSPGTEAAIGLSFKSRGHVPLELLVERRIGFNRGGRDDFAIVAITGMNDVPIARTTVASAYLQAGMVGFTKAELFADGAMRLERRLVSAGPTDISLGFGGWGAIQSGASRLDIGPIISSRLRIGSAAVRVSAEWRQRIAGGASPASGPALTIGMDF